jgi:hypothetical protein
MRELQDSRAREVTLALIVGGTLLFVIVLGAVLLLAGKDGSSAGTQPVETVGSVPVGVKDTPAGALAAADDYVALSSQSVEQDPALFAELVAQVYAPEIRERTLVQAARIRAADTQNMSNYSAGGRGIAVIAARRLDAYTPRSATVTSWLAGFVWGPHLVPHQSWNLVDTTLRWQGRWLVTASETDRTPAPVPAIVFVNGRNDRSQAFARLAGMTAPFYGTAG